MVIWDVAQQVQIRAMRKSQVMGDRELHLRDQRHEARAEELENRIEQVVLVTEALYRICQERLDLTDDDLRDAVQAIVDEREAKRSTAPTPCPVCGAAILADQLRCQYCGTESGHTPELFRGR